MQDLRKKRRMTQISLAVQTGISQPRLSKLEYGKATCTEAEAAKLLDILAAPAHIRQQFMHLLLHPGDARGQGVPIDVRNFHFDQAYNLERKARVVRVFSACLIPALLQTLSFRQALLLAHAVDPAALPRIMHSTTARQDYYWQQPSKFRLLLHETALYTQFTSSSDHLMQLDRLERILGYRQCNVGIVPYRQNTGIGSIVSFAVHDNKLLIRDIGTTEIYATDTLLVQQYSHLFDTLHAHAAFGSSAIQAVRSAMDYLASERAAPAADTTRNTDEYAITLPAADRRAQ